MIKYKIIENEYGKYCLLRYHFYFIPYIDERSCTLEEYRIDSSLGNYGFVKKYYNSFEEVEKRIIQIEQEKHKNVKNIYPKIAFSTEKNAKIEFHIIRFLRTDPHYPTWLILFLSFINLLLSIFFAFSQVGK